MSPQILILHLSLALLSSLVSGLNFPVDQNGTLSPHTPVLGSTSFSVNAAGEVQVMVRHSVAVLLCVQRTVPPPAPEQYPTCTFALPFAASSDGKPTTHSATLPLTQDLFYWGLYYGNTTVEEVDAVRLHLTAPTCPAPQVFDGTRCTSPTPILAGTPLSVGLSTTPMVLAVSIPALTGSLTLVAPGASLAARAQAAPTPLLADGRGTGTLTVAAPRPGQWYWALTTPQPTTMNVTLQVESCPDPLHQGPGCATNITAASALLTLVTLDLGSLAYFRVQVTDVAPLFVRVQAEAGVPPLVPQVWASQGQLPLSAALADIAGCTQAACTAPSIQLPNGTVAEGGSALWYVAVSLPPSANGTVAVWFDSVCAPNCEEHGNCEGSGASEGVCLCLVDYRGVDCSVPQTSLGAQYIVLIIIASLVVASALVGFIAWIVMRRRRALYQAV